MADTRERSGPRLAVSQLCVRAGSRALVDGVSFCVLPGELETSRKPGVMQEGRGLFLLGESALRPTAQNVHTARGYASRTCKQGVRGIRRALSVALQVSPEGGAGDLPTMSCGTVTPTTMASRMT